MTTQNLVLTEKAIARHTKRLIKELATINHNLKLSEAQNMLSRILGMKDFYELKQVLKFDTIDIVTPLDINSDTNVNKDVDYYTNINNFITLDYAQQNLEKFFADGSIDIILKFLDSKDLAIQEYIKLNSFDFFNIAAKNNHVFLLRTIINKKLINLHDFTEKQIQDFYFNLLAYENNSLDSFNYIFYELKFPENLSQYLIGMITHNLATNTNIKDIHNDLDSFLHDERVSFQKDFYWNKTLIKDDKISPQYDLSSCALNSACSRGNLDVVKYFIEKEKLLPFEDGSTVKSACASGNLQLVKYLINTAKAPFNYFKKNNHKKLTNKDLTYSLDFSTLSSAVKSGNLELVEYLIDTKKLKVSDYDYLALRVALIESSSIYKYFITIDECREYIQQHAQEIFDQVIYKIHYNGKINNQNIYKTLQQNQYDIALELLAHYGVVFKDVVTVSDNAKLIQLLVTCEENNKLCLSLMSHTFSLKKDSGFYQELLGASQKTCVIISPSEVVRKSLKLFLNKNDKVDNVYTFYTFENVNDYKHYISFNPQKIDLIICDNDMSLDEDIASPIIYLTEDSKENVFYSLMCKLVFADYTKEAIHDLKDYINLHVGQVDFKFWYLLLTACQKISHKSQFDKIALTFCHKFDIKDNFDFDTFVFVPENNSDNFLLAKPFSKEDVTKILSYISMLS